MKKRFTDFIVNIFAVCGYMTKHQLQPNCVIVEKRLFSLYADSNTQIHISAALNNRHANFSGIVIVMN